MKFPRVLAQQVGEMPWSDILHVFAKQSHSSDFILLCTGAFHAD